MRHHFHRCPNLQTVAVAASDLHGARRGGSAVLDELCRAKRLEPCVGLVECDVLTARQKQTLLVERATRIRSEEGGATPLAGVPEPRARELRRVRERLVRERDAIVEQNLRTQVEMGGGEDREWRAGASEEAEMAAAGLSLRLDETLARLQAERLDEIDRALSAMQDLAYGTCALCRGEIELVRLEGDPQTRVCDRCAGEPPSPQRRPRAASAPR